MRGIARALTARGTQTARGGDWSGVQAGGRHPAAVRAFESPDGFPSTGTLSAPPSPPQNPRHVKPSRWLRHPAFQFPNQNLRGHPQAPCRASASALAAKRIMQRHLRDRFTLVPCATSNYGRLCAHIDGLAQEMIAHGVAVPYVPCMRHRESRANNDRGRPYPRLPGVHLC